MIRLSIIGMLGFVLVAVHADQGHGLPISLKAVKSGVSINSPKAYEGYTLIAPMKSTCVFLVDMKGRIVHTWETGHLPGLNTILLDNGNLLRSCTAPIDQKDAPIPGIGGRIMEFTWDGEIVWDYTFPRNDQVPHHDITKLPNGNVLIVVAERKTAKEAIAVGRRPDSVRDTLLPDAIVEVRPTGKTTGEIVWEWRVWDHLVQDFDREKPNFGRVSSRPERIDVNFTNDLFGKHLSKQDDLDKLKGLGYLGGTTLPKIAPKGPQHDWTHLNSVAYHAELDQIVITSFGFHELWIIDHSTTTEEASGSRGGKYGKGGDLLYRWGNPRAYRSGTNADQRLFSPHDAHFIPQGMPGAGNLIVFNNGEGRPSGSFSSVEELIPPPLKNGGYDYKPGSAMGPKSAHWSFTTPTKTDFFSPFICGAHRLPNGNTLICYGLHRIVFEVTPDKEVVWLFKFDGDAFSPLSGSSSVLPAKLESLLNLTPDQKKQLAGMQIEAFSKLEKILTKAQKAELQRLHTGYDTAVPKTGGLFRSYRIGLDSPALKGRKLTSLPTN